MDYFQSLPPEIVLHIFWFLPAETLRCAVPLVCKSFRDYAYCDTLLTAVRYKYKQRTVAVFQEFLQKQKRLQTLTVKLQNLFWRTCCPDYHFPELPSLTKLVLVGSHYLNFIHLKNNYPNLKELKLINLYLCELFENGQCHSEDDCPKENCSAFEHVCKKFLTLEKLTIADFKCIDDDIDAPCIEWTHLRFLSDSLKELKISSQRLSYSELKNITNSCTRLETFHFETLCYIDCISDLLWHLPLRDLALTIKPSFHNYGPKPAEEITHRHFYELFRRLPELVRCSFKASDQFDNTVLQYLTVHCKKLEVIKLKQLSCITDVGIMCLIARLENLKELHVLNCVHSDKENVVACLSANKNLRLICQEEKEDDDDYCDNELN